MERKPDADDIATFLDGLALRLRRKSTNDFRSRWLDYLFHVTHIHAAVAALADGRLLSRTQLEREGSLGFDTAAPDIIEHTQPEVRDHVRLYFRPLTPTFFHSEGVRAKGDRSPLGSHCPIPVALLFDAKAVLCRQGTICSDGNASSPRANFGSDLSFISALPFEAIYDNGPMPEGEAKQIKFRRCAEVLVPGFLPTQNLLRHVFVRSSAEFQMFQSLARDELGEEAAKIVRLVRVNRRTGLFFKRWTYVEHVETLGDHVRVMFNASTESPGPFVASIRLSDLETTDLIRDDKIHDFMAHRRLDYPLPPQALTTAFRFELLLDEHLVFQGDFHPPYDHALIDPF